MKTVSRFRISGFRSYRAGFPLLFSGFLIFGAGIFLLLRDSGGERESSFSDLEGEEEIAVWRAERISYLREEIREEVEERLRLDAEAVSEALREISGYLDEYATGIEPFVAKVHSLGVKGRLLYALYQDFASLDYRMLEAGRASWSGRISEGGWRTVGMSDLAAIVMEALEAGFVFPKLESVVEEIWREAFDDRIDLLRVVSERLERLTGAIEAGRNRLALGVGELFEEMLRLQGLPVISVEEWMERTGKVVSESGAGLAGRALGAEFLAFGGGELAAYSALLISRGVADRLAGELGSRFAGTLVARSGSAFAAGLSSGWATFGLSVVVAGAVDFAFDSVSKRRMRDDLGEGMREFRKRFWEGDGEMPGIYPELVAAFVEYRERMLGLTEMEPEKLGESVVFVDWPEVR